MYVIVMAMDLVEIGRRIRQVRGPRGGKEFGDMIGVSFTVVSAYEKGNAWPKPQTLDKIISISGKAADWLLYGREQTEIAMVAESQEEYIATMPVLALAGAGPPCTITDLEPIGQITVEKSYDGPHIRVVRIRGESMEPTIMDGAHCGIDVTTKEIVSGQLYAVFIPYEGIVVKRIWIGPELIKIVSDNPSAPDHDMSIDRINWDTFVQGKVKWVIQEY